MWGRPAGDSCPHPALCGLRSLVPAHGAPHSGAACPAPPGAPTVPCTQPSPAVPGQAGHLLAARRPPGGHTGPCSTSLQARPSLTVKNSKRPHWERGQLLLSGPPDPSVPAGSALLVQVRREGLRLGRGGRGVRERMGCPPFSLTTAHPTQLRWGWCWGERWGPRRRQAGRSWPHPAAARAQQGDRRHPLPLPEWLPRSVPLGQTVPL